MASGGALPGLICAGLSDLIIPPPPTCGLQHFSLRAFALSAPSGWNALPGAVHTPSSPSILRSTVNSLLQPFWVLLFNLAAVTWGGPGSRCLKAQGQLSYPSTCSFSSPPHLSPSCRDSSTLPCPLSQPQLAPSLVFLNNISPPL